MSERHAKDVHRCPVCDEPMYADQEWRLRKGLETGKPASSGDYVHEECWGKEVSDST